MDKNEIGRICSLLRQIGSVEDFDTVLYHNGSTFILHDDASVSVDDVVYFPRADLGRYRGPRILK